MYNQALAEAVNDKTRYNVVENCRHRCAVPVSLGSPSHGMPPRSCANQAGANARPWLAASNAAHLRDGRALTEPCPSAKHMSGELPPGRARLRHKTHRAPAPGGSPPWSW